MANLSSRRKSQDKIVQPTDVKPQVKTSAEERQSRILKESLKEIDAQINFKTQRRDRAQTVKEWKVCDNLTTEIRKIFKGRADLEAELKILERKNQQSQWYRKRKVQDNSHVVPQGKATKTTVQNAPPSIYCFTKKC